MSRDITRWDATEHSEEWARPMIDTLICNLVATTSSTRVISLDVYDAYTKVKISHPGGGLYCNGELRAKGFCSSYWYTFDQGKNWYCHDQLTPELNEKMNVSSARLEGSHCTVHFDIATDYWQAPRGRGIILK